MLNRLTYSLLIYIFLPLIIGRTLWRSIKNPAHRQRLLERLGFFTGKLQVDPSSGSRKTRAAHFHLVSVGETLAAIPVVKAFQQQHPDLPIVLTCTTLTGSIEIQKRLSNVQHVYLPWDTIGGMARFYRVFNPQLSIIMETELWPNMFYQAEKHQCKLVVMNARLSKKSARNYAKIPNLLKPMLNRLTYLCSQNQETSDRYLSLGLPPAKLVNTGNVKFDIEIPEGLLDQAKALRHEFGAERFIWVAGSTHQGEDEIILRAHQALLKAIPNALLILVPRHPERFNQVYEQIKQSELFTARRSEHNNSLTNCQVYLGDTMGELMLFYAVGDVAFVGGSLVGRGGHNPLEPAILNKPIVSGPQVFNFQTIYDLLDEKGAVLFADSPNNLMDALLKLSNKEQAKIAQSAARIVLDSHSGSVNKTLKVLTNLI